MEKVAIRGISATCPRRFAGVQVASELVPLDFQRRGDGCGGGALGRMPEEFCGSVYTGFGV